MMNLCKSLITMTTNVNLLTNGLQSEKGTIISN